MPRTFHLTDRLPTGMLRAEFVTHDTWGACVEIQMTIGLQEQPYTVWMDYKQALQMDVITMGGNHPPQPMDVEAFAEDLTTLLLGHAPERGLDGRAVSAVETMEESGRVPNARLLVTLHDGSEFEVIIYRRIGAGA